MKHSYCFLLLVILPVAAVCAAGQSGHEHQHDHDQVDASGYPQLPGVQLEVAADAMAGWNIHLRTENFRFAPEHVNTEPVPGEGHAHLYVDGVKTARLYGPWFHLGELAPGRHTLRVTLNANNHGELAVGGEPIAASRDIVQ